jgi:methylase of polypeptide subunit release factors
MCSEEIPSKPKLHQTFMQGLRHLWQQTKEPAHNPTHLATSRILDLGCGDGRLSLSLVDEAAAERANLEWVGTDVCQNAVKHARELASLQGVSSRHLFASARSCLGSDEW